MGKCIYGNTVGGGGLPKSFLLETEDGVQLVGVTVGEETVFDAEPNDVRMGKIYAGENGVEVGEKFIPNYLAHQGSSVILPGKPVILSTLDYDYTKLQAMVCAYNTTLTNSVAVEVAIINDNVYAVQSTDSLAIIKINSIDKKIEFGITNDGDNIQILRYFYFKEIE